jgi:hypothetical protein
MSGWRFLGPTAVRWSTHERPVDARAAARASRGWPALGLQVTQEAKRRKLVGARGFEPPTT